MKLVADAGASKTDWVLISDNNLEHTQTQGIHPSFIKPDEIKENLGKNGLLSKSRNSSLNIYFYGTGCSSQNHKDLIHNLLKKLFKHSKISVFSDILGAARGLFLQEEGIACILGTGTNCCRYNGNEIIKCTPSLGYILGDEGSGAYFGKKLIQQYFYNKMPGDLSKQFQNQYKIEKEQILNQLFSHNQPNTFLAGFAGFLHLHKSHQFIQNLIEQGLTDFFENHIKVINPKRNEKIRFTGSIAWYLQDFLFKISSQYNLTVDKVIQSPIEGLAMFHEKEY
jgi:N-acetylglucosamine kinase-like BadF-type ATPase